MPFCLLLPKKEQYIYILYNCKYKVLIFFVYLFVHLFIHSFIYISTSNTTFHIPDVFDEM